MKKYIFNLLLLFCCTCSVYAQNSSVEVQTNRIEVEGLVTDESKEPLIGVNVIIKDIPGLGAITDIDGKFKIKMEPYHRLVFSFIGFEKQEVLIKEQRTIKVIMKEATATALDEVVVTGTGAQKKITMTGAVTNVDINTLKTSTSSITNALAGNIAGVMARQTSGQPGNNISEFWIRGISTFGAGSSALILVDGFERSMNELNIEDIESFTVLKDASATAIYGSRGANGVVLITTKRGKGGKVQIDAKVETTYNTRTITPDLIDGYTYASMMNEARTTRNQEPFFPEDKLYILRNGLDQDLYPNVDWMDVLLKKGAPTYRATINMNGGGSLARYYVSASYVDEGGMYKVDKGLKDYNTNANYRRWNYRLNVDMDITKTTLLKVGVSGSLDKKNEPGMSSNIWASAMNYNPVSVPIMYSNGYTPAFGSDDEQINPWTIATQTGYQETWNNKLQTNITLEQDFSFITKGLKFIGRYGFDTNNYQWINRKKIPELWRAEQNRASDGSLVMRKVRDEQLMSQEANSTGERKEYLEAELHYDRTFGNHMVGAVMKYTQDKTINASVKKEDDIMQGIDRRHQGLSGRFTYGWKYRYFVDFNFGYNGSENFATGHQFGFFPAYSVAWNIAEESFIKEKSPWINMFKVRYSYGKVGNDNMDRRLLVYFRSKQQLQLCRPRTKLSVRRIDLYLLCN
jgi:TonB-linked SusC/RagA family outer membrane protein